MLGFFLGGGGLYFASFTHFPGIFPGIFIYSHHDRLQATNLLSQKKTELGREVYDQLSEPISEPHLM